MIAAATAMDAEGLNSLLVGWLVEQKKIHLEIDSMLFSVIIVFVVAVVVGSGNRHN